jgi:hypothetical protein
MTVGTETASMNPGDCAIIGYYSTGDMSDDFRVLLLKDLPAGAWLYATDKGWTSNAATTSGQHWDTTAGSGEWMGSKTYSEMKPAGTVLSGVADFQMPAGSLDANGDSVIVYTTDNGAAAGYPVTFLCGFITGNDGWQIAGPYMPRRRNCNESDPAVEPPPIF